MPKRKVCPRCGATFECLHDQIALCHCATVRLDENSRNYVKANYSDCLCHECLLEIKKTLSEEQINNTKIL